MYFVRRLIFLIPTLLVISLLAFILVRLAPGSPFDKERKPASPEVERALKAKYHMDEPMWKQYLRYLGNLAQGDFGLSLIYRNHSVNDIIRQGFPVSMTLGLTAFLFAQGIGIPLGFYGAVRRGKPGDYITSLFALLAICIPSLVIGPLLIMVFVFKWKWLPAGLWESPVHMILPTIALGLYFAGRISRLMREGMSGILHSEFITAARAKGVSEAAALVKHAFRLSVLPVVSYSGPLLADLLTGSFVVEKIFNVPGIGIFLVNSSLNRDYFMVVGLTLLYAVMLLILNLMADLTYGLLDPRVKYE